MADDFNLLSAWQAGDVEAGDTLVRRHFVAVYRFFASKVPAEAEDLTQRAFLASTEVKRRVDPRLGFRGYLFGIARRLLMDHLRQQYRAPRAAPIEDITIAELTGVRADEVVGRTELDGVVLAALRELPLQFQTTLELHYWDDLSVAEIAAITDVAEGTVKSRLTRARAMLTDRLRKHRVRGDVGDWTLRDLIGWTKSLGEVLGARARRPD